MTKLRHKKKRGKPISFTDLSNPFQRLRSQLGWSQRQMALALGLGFHTVQCYEWGTRLPRPANAQRFLALAHRHRLRMSMDEIYQKKGV